MKTRVDYTLGDREERPWGRWEVIAIGDDHVVKHLIVRPGFRSSMQRHSGRNEHWIILQGELEATVNGETRTLKTADHTYISVGSLHRMHNVGSSPVAMIEIQTGHHLSEDDIERLEDDFGRASA